MYGMEDIYSGRIQDPIAAMSDPYSDQRVVSMSERTDYAQATGKDVNDVSDEMVRGKTGFAATRIRSHYGGPADGPKIDPNEVVDLSPEKRLEVLSRMRQNVDPVADPNGQARCGATSLLAGCMYGDGAQGIEKLVQAMEDARKKEKGYDPKKDPGMDKDLAGLMARIKDGKDLTMGDLDMMQGKTFDFLQKMQGIKPRQPGDPVLKGLDGKQITAFIAQSPALKKMFEEKEMGLDSIDLSGDGQGEHIVLGIGRDNMGPKGTRSMIYDPYSRQDKRNSGQFMKYDDVEDIRRDERAKMQDQYTEIWDSDMSTEQKLAAAEKLDEKVQEKTHARQYAYKPASQLVTSHAELGDYARATDYQGTGTGTRDLKAQTEAERPFMGMYY